MIVSRTYMREELLPGLRLISCRCSFAEIKDIFAASVFNSAVPVVAEVTASISLPTAAAMGMAAVVIKNPVVSRRFWSR